MYEVLKGQLDKLEITKEDSLGKCFAKGLSQGAVTMTFIVGLLAVTQNVTGIKLLKFRKGC